MPPAKVLELVRLACDVECMNFGAKVVSDVVKSYSIVTADVAKPETFKKTINMVKSAIIY